MNMAAHSHAGSGNHTASYYAASANPAPVRPALKGTATVDVCVVGAGYTRLSTALHLAEKGHAVAVIAGARVGWGASGRNGGQIVNGLNASLGTIERRHGARTAGHMGDGAERRRRLATRTRIIVMIERQARRT